MWTNIRLQDRYIVYFTNTDYVLMLRKYDEPNNKLLIMLVDLWTCGYTCSSTFAGLGPMRQQIKASKGNSQAGGLNS